MLFCVLCVAAHVFAAWCRAHVHVHVPVHVHVCVLLVNATYIVVEDPAAGGTTDDATQGTHRGARSSNKHTRSTHHRAGAARTKIMRHAGHTHDTCTCTGYDRYAINNMAEDTLWLYQLSNYGSVRQHISGCVW